MCIKDHIAASGLSRADICKQVGISRGMLSLIEKGKRRIGADKAPKLAQAIGVPVDQVRPDLADIFAPSAKGATA